MNIEILKKKSFDYVFFVVNNVKICVFYIQNECLNLPRVVNNHRKNECIFLLLFSFLFFSIQQVKLAYDPYTKLCLCFIPTASRIAHFVKYDTIINLIFLPMNEIVLYRFVDGITTLQSVSSFSYSSIQTSKIHDHLIIDLNFIFLFSLNFVILFEIFLLHQDYFPSILLK
jgi:hypothetical protein